MKNSGWTSEQAETSWGSDFTRPGFDRDDDITAPTRLILQLLLFPKTF